MSTVIRSEVSKKNPFWIPKHRYYELKHFCYQFWDWQARRASLDGLATREHRAPTEPEAIERAVLDSKIEMVMDTMHDAAGEFDMILLQGVTKGLTYDQMNARKPVPFCREKYYQMYRKFFWMLDAVRQ